MPYSGLRKGGLLHKHSRQHATKTQCWSSCKDPPFPTPPACPPASTSTTSTAPTTCLPHPPPTQPHPALPRHLPILLSQPDAAMALSSANAGREPLCLTHSHPPLFSLTPSRNSEIKLRASSTHRRISLRSAGWPSRSLACSFVCRSALTTASSSPLCLVSLPPSKGTREPARRPPRPPTASQPSL